MLEGVVDSVHSSANGFNLGGQEAVQVLGRGPVIRRESSVRFGPRT